MLQGCARIAIGFNIVSMSSLELFFIAGSVLVVIWGGTIFALLGFHCLELSVRDCNVSVFLH